MKHDACLGPNAQPSLKPAWPHLNKPGVKIQLPARLKNRIRGVWYSCPLKVSDYQIVARRGLKWLECAALADVPRLIHAFSTRAGSTHPVSGLNLGYTKGAARPRVSANRRIFLRALGAGGFPLAEVHQIHSTLVFCVRRGKDGELEYLPSGYPAPAQLRSDSIEGDALVTDEPGILLSVRSADCVPVLIADSKGSAVAAVHAGWKGMLGGIVEKTVGEMRRLFGSRPGALIAAIGPSIRDCCYEVGQELHSSFCGRFPEGESFFRKLPDDKIFTERNPYPPPFLSFAPPGHGPDPGARPHLDLVAVTRYQLRRAGVQESRIRVADFCTSCRSDLFFSHRKEGSRAGRMMAVIGILAESKRRSSRLSQARPAGKARRTARRTSA
jgi:purine-nucleoside/S-methyl-5'-thioadenosine phosphorylase / adenosine deaminase